MKITNNKSIPLALALWLVGDDYDYQNIENYVSVTGLIKPVKQTILSSRAKKIAINEGVDLEDMIPSRLGHAIHSAVEKEWIQNTATNFQKLGYSMEEARCVLVNPTKEQLLEAPGAFVVWIEQRAYLKIGKWTIGGKFDIVIDGEVQDVKSTTVYSFIKGGKDEDYILQGSIYRLLNPDKITKDTMQINFVFTDWQSAEAKRDPNYPQCRATSKTFQLMSVEDTLQWVKDRLAQLEAGWGSPEELIAPCTPAELWLSDPVFKYYSDPATAQAGGRSTKNFNDYIEANTFLSSKGKGVIVAIPQEAKRCGYCNGAPLCKQKEQYRHD